MWIKVSHSIDNTPGAYYFGPGGITKMAEERNDRGELKFTVLASDECHVASVNEDVAWLMSQLG